MAVQPLPLGVAETRIEIRNDLGFFQMLKSIKGYLVIIFFS